MYQRCSQTEMTLPALASTTSMCLWRIWGRHCEVLDIPIITIGYPDMKNALEKAKATGTDPEQILKNADKPNFMVVDMRRNLGMMVQLIVPRAAQIHNLLINSRKDWDGSTDLFRKLG